MTVTFTFDLVSPEKLLMSQPVEMVTLPGSEGEFGILAGHAPLIASLKPGVITIRDKGQVAERLFVAGGFAEVTPTACTVLAEGATPLSDLNLSDVNSEIQNLRANQQAATDLPSPALLIAEAKREALLTNTADKR